MRVLVTVGTGSFSSLIFAAERIAKLGHEMTYQIGSSQKYPNFLEGEIFRYRKGIKLEEYDFVITHAGAGTVFSALEKGLRLLIVPNLERPDNHQIELGRYIERARLAEVCWDPAYLIQSFLKAQTGDYRPYHKDPFMLPMELLACLAGNQ